MTEDRIVKMGVKDFEEVIEMKNRAVDRQLEICRMKRDLKTKKIISISFVCLMILIAVVS